MHTPVGKTSILLHVKGLAFMASGFGFRLQAGGFNVEGLVYHCYEVPGRMLVPLTQLRLIRLWMASNYSEHHEVVAGL